MKSKTKDDSIQWYKTTIIPIFDQQKIISHDIAIRTNIIKIKEKLILSERLPAIGELSARVSHDIGNPLATIKNSNELLKLLLEGKLDEKSIKLLDFSDKAVERISHQINDVLNYVQKVPLKTKSCDINEIIHSAINTSNIPKSMKINVHNKSIIINCDPVQLEIVFINLI